jgi:hypothetical protein
MLMEAPMQLATLQNEIAQGDIESGNPIPIQLLQIPRRLRAAMTAGEPAENEMLAWLNNGGQTHSLILGQCFQLLRDKMKQDTDWTAVSVSCDPLTFCVD